MTREEEIRKEAELNILFNHRTADVSLGGTMLKEFGISNFEAGARYADTHPAKSDSKRTAPIEAWLARNRNGILSLYGEEPNRTANDFVGGFIMLFHEDKIPSVTWENSPKKVKVTIELEEEK